MDLNDSTAESLRALPRRLEERARTLSRESVASGSRSLSDLLEPPAPPERPPAPPPPRVRAAPERQIVFGESRRGEPIRCYLLGEGACDTLVLGGFHGDERNTAPVVERLRALLKSEPAHLAGGMVGIAPLVNPDGWAARTRVNAGRVDINRNFPHGWKPFARAPRYFPGFYPRSEPETRAIMELMTRLRPRKVVTLHNPLRCLNFDGEKGLPLALAMRRHNRYPIKADIGYPTPGSFGAHFGRTPGIGIVTLELPPVSTEAAWRENRAALVAAIALRVSG